MARYAMVTDLRTCVGCHACTVSCNAEWDVPPGEARTHVHTTGATGTFPGLLASTYVAQCNQCDRPSCVEVCPSTATHKDGNGVIVVDRDVCIGCGYCVEACAYDARFISARTKKVDKCNFCAPRVARGDLPACVATCPAGAKHFGDLEDRTGEVHRMVFHDGAQRIETDSVALGPNVYYLGTPKQLELVQAKYPPRAPQLLTSGEALKGLIKPFVIGAIGLTFAGQAVAFFAQLYKGESDFDE